MLALLLAAAAPAAARRLEALSGALKEAEYELGTVTLTKRFCGLPYDDAGATDCAPDDATAYDSAWMQACCTLHPPLIDSLVSLPGHDLTRLSADDAPVAGGGATSERSSRADRSCLGRVRSFALPFRLN